MWLRNSISHDFKSWRKHTSMSIPHHWLIQAEQLRSQVFSSSGEKVSALLPDKPVQRERWGLGSSGAVSSFWNRNSIGRIEQLLCRGPGGLLKIHRSRAFKSQGPSKVRAAVASSTWPSGECTHEEGHNLLATTEIYRKLTMLFEIASPGLSDTLHRSSWVLSCLWNFQCVAS